MKAWLAAYRGGASKRASMMIIVVNMKRKIIKEKRVIDGSVISKRRGAYAARGK